MQNEVIINWADTLLVRKATATSKSGLTLFAKYRSCAVTE